VTPGSSTDHCQVWEFQHPNFQAGGKADLDSIKVSPSQTRESLVDSRSRLTVRSAKPSCQRRVQRKARPRRLLRDREVQAG
jgi:hypothetical protein